ncbi:MAG: hypothetical protein RID91_01050 [Azospirillaceae bacterium]
MTAAQTLFAPTPPPPAPGAARAARRREALPLAGLLVAIVLANRFGVQIGGVQLQAALPLAAPVIVWGVWSGGLRLDPGRLAAFAGAAAVLTGCTIVSAGAISLPSLALVLVLYLVLTLVPAGEAWGGPALLSVFRTLMTALAAAGIAQYVLQFALPTSLLFSFQGLVPDAILREGTNTVIPIHYGADIVKSNGVVFSEPSAFSQHVALALLIELLFFGSVPRLVLYAVALVVAYSGTGMVMVAVFGPFAALAGRRVNVTAMVVLAIPAAVVLGALIDWTALLDRVDELGSTQSSGFARFLSPFWILRDFVIDRPIVFLTGAGPGSVEGFLADTWYESHDPTWAKLMIEYGAVGTAAFAVFYFYTTLSGVRSAILSLAAALQYAVLGGGFLSPSLVLTIWLLVIASQRAAPARDRHPPRRPGAEPRLGRTPIPTLFPTSDQGAGAAPPMRP